MTNTETPTGENVTLKDLKRGLIRQAMDLDRLFIRSLESGDKRSNDYYPVALKAQAQYRQCIQHLETVKRLKKKSAESTNEVLKDTE